MAKKKTNLKGNQTTVVVQTQQVKSKPKQQKNNANNGKKSMRRAAWLTSLTNPFNAPACGIPDERTVMSGKVTTRYTGIFQPSCITGTGTAHSGGMLFFPYPKYLSYGFREMSNGSGTFSDLNATGTAPNDDRVWPALSSIYGGDSANAARVRCVSMGVRITYEGTELNRAGRITVGNCTAVDGAETVASTGTYLSALSTVTGHVVATSDQLLSSFTNSTSSRNTDGVVEGHWIPNGVPSYQLIDGQAPGTGVIERTTPITTGIGIRHSVFNTSVGSGGVESGQSVLMLFIEGDTTATAGAFGNTYRYEVIAQWEVLPDSPNSVIYSLTPSPYDVSALAATLNGLALTSPGRVMRGSTQGMSVQPTDSGSSTWMSNLMPSSDQLVRGAEMAFRTYMSAVAARRQADMAGRFLEL